MYEKEYSLEQIVDVASISTLEIKDILGIEGSIYKVCFLIYVEIDFEKINKNAI